MRSSQRTAATVITSPHASAHRVERPLIRRSHRGHGGRNNDAPTKPAAKRFRNGTCSRTVRCPPTSPSLARMAAVHMSPSRGGRPPALHANIPARNHLQPPQNRNAVCPALGPLPPLATRTLSTHRRSHLVPPRGSPDALWTFRRGPTRADRGRGLRRPVWLRCASCLGLQRPLVVVARRTECRWALPSSTAPR
jgi:hypothetical protein